MPRIGSWDRYRSRPTARCRHGIWRRWQGGGGGGREGDRERVRARYRRGGGGQERKAGEETEGRRERNRKGGEGGHVFINGLRRTHKQTDLVNLSSLSISLTL